jgi:hypothetical protein
MDSAAGIIIRAAVTTQPPTVVPLCHLVLLPIILHSWRDLVESLFFPEGAHPLFWKIARFSHSLVKLVTLRRHSTERGEFATFRE